MFLYGYNPVIYAQSFSNIAQIARKLTLCDQKRIDLSHNWFSLRFQYGAIFYTLVYSTLQIGITRSV